MSTLILFPTHNLNNELRNKQKYLFKGRWKDLFLSQQIPQALPRNPLAKVAMESARESARDSAREYLLSFILPFNSSPTVFCGADHLLCPPIPLCPHFLYSTKILVAHPAFLPRMDLLLNTPSLSYLSSFLGVSCHYLEASSTLDPPVTTPSIVSEAFTARQHMATTVS